MSQPCDTIPPPPDTNTSTPRVKAVYIHCVGDRKVLGRPKYTEVMILDSHVIFTRERPTDISVNMGLPILTFKTGQIDLRWVNKKAGIDYPSSKNPMSNRKSVFLNLRANPKGDSWGWADVEKWNTIIGTVLVARQDKRDITAHQVEALARFCFYVLQPTMEEQMEDCAAMKRKSDRIKARETFTRIYMCQAKFEEFFEKLKAEKIAGGISSWANAVSPYNQS